eukprot:TRINITY_DN16184_c0_g3_i1.p1 TRINITY_DN16184_c0_g3~~TRINITY_DN16184_c0_g3_i1.p1  ORF type:complete len:442 (+),score=117.91 TRINITY_DN16184_c0_g3_i1:37-1326(+)
MVEEGVASGELRPLQVVASAAPEEPAAAVAAAAAETSSSPPKEPAAAGSQTPISQTPAANPEAVCQSPQATRQQYVQRQVKLLLESLGQEAFASQDLRRQLREANQKQPWFKAAEGQLVAAVEQHCVQLPGPLRGQLSDPQLLAAALILLKAHMGSAGAAEASAALAAASEAKSASQLLAWAGEGGEPMAWQEVVSFLARLTEVAPDPQDHEVICKICAEHVLPRFRAEQVRRLGQAFVSLLAPASSESPKSSAKPPVVGISGGTKVQGRTEAGADAAREAAIEMPRTATATATRASRQGRLPDSDDDSEENEEDVASPSAGARSRGMAASGSSNTWEGRGSLRRPTGSPTVDFGGAQTTSAYKLRQQAAAAGLSQTSSCAGSPVAGAGPKAGKPDLSTMIRKDPAWMIAARAAQGDDSEDEIAELDDF